MNSLLLEREVFFLNEMDGFVCLLVEMEMEMKTKN